MGLLSCLCPCCCGAEEELTPLRFSHANGISSTDRNPHALELNEAAQLAEEAAKAAQEQAKKVK